VGRRLDVSPLFVFLGLWFGGWLWGIAGVALAVPVMVGIKSAINAGKRESGNQEHAGPEPEETVRHRARDWAARTSWRHRSPELRETVTPRDRSSSVG
jgi:hypothetical protein